MRLKFYTQFAPLLEIPGTYHTYTLPPGENVALLKTRRGEDGSVYFLCQYPDRGVDTGDVAFAWLHRSQFE